ncbi:MAG: 50S ribosomal protein L24 [Patescibacteria group bacterium]|nr:50S ribosomal protein L24 [Patescibacteria group bacterium]
MNIRKNDTVKIIKGKDRGKSGRVLQVVKKDEDRLMVTVEGLNLRYKHLRPRRDREKGQRIMFPALMDATNVMLVCPKCGKATRIGFQINAEKSELTREKKQRICKKCSAVI